MGDDEVGSRLKAVLLELEPLEASLLARTTAERLELATLTQQKQELAARIENAPVRASALETRRARAVDAAKFFAFGARDENRAKVIVAASLVLAMAMAGVWIALNLRNLVAPGLGLQLGCVIAGYYAAWRFERRRRR
jgi:hypothetical protein